MFEAIISKDDKETLLELADVLFVLMGHVESTGNSGIQAINDITKKNSKKTIEKAMKRELKARLGKMGVHTKDLNKVIQGKLLPANKEAAKIVQRKIAAANIVGAKAKDTYTKTLQSIGKISGTYAGITGLESGINLHDIYKDTGELKPGIAFKYGALAGAAETPVALFWLANWAKLGGRFKKVLTD